MTKSESAGGEAEKAERVPRTARFVFIPKPVMHVAGENDPLVKFTWQKLMIDALRKRNQCDDGKPWSADKRCTIYPSRIDAPVVAYIHSGTHQYPKAAPEIIVKFFKEHAKPDKKQANTRSGKRHLASPREG